MTGRSDERAGLAKICHPERSIAIGFFNRNAESRDLLLGSRRVARPSRVLCERAGL
jgi:hypothetical protein